MQYAITELDRALLICLLKSSSQAQQLLQQVHILQHKDVEQENQGIPNLSPFTMIQLWRLLNEKLKLDEVLGFSHQFKLPLLGVDGLILATSPTLNCMLTGFTTLNSQLLTMVFSRRNKQLDISFVAEQQVMQQNLNLIFILSLFQLITEHQPYAAKYLCATLPDRYDLQLIQQLKHTGLQIQLSRDLKGGLSIDESALQLPLLTSDAQLYQLLNCAKTKIRQSETDIIELVNQTIAEQIAQEQPTLESVAISLNMSSRYLQHSLKQHQVCFRQLLANALCRKAQSLLRYSTLSLGEIAYDLGYSNKQSFFRAFRSWQQMTPSEYRALYTPLK